MTRSQQLDTTSNRVCAPTNSGTLRSMSRDRAKSLVSHCFCMKMSRRLRDIDPTHRRSLIVRHDGAPQHVIRGLTMTCIPSVFQSIVCAWQWALSERRTLGVLRLGKPRHLAAACTACTMLWAGATPLQSSQSPSRRLLVLTTLLFVLPTFGTPRSFNRHRR